MLILLYLLLKFSTCELVHVIELGRHGIRTPRFQFDWTYDEPLQTLTEAGYQQHVKLGKVLRENYQLLISEEFNPEEVYFRSTNLTRTIRSLEGQIEGLYGPECRPQVRIMEFNQSQIHFENPPQVAAKECTPEIITTPLQEDALLMTSHACPRVRYLLKRDRYDTDFYSSFLQQAKQHQEQITALTNHQNITIETLEILGDIITSYQSRNLTFPVDISDELRDFAVKSYFDTINEMVYGSKEQGKLGVHLFLYRILETGKRLLSKEEKRRIQIYLGHDINLIPILRMLGQKIDSTPKAAQILIEFHLEASEMFLVFLYQGEKFTVSGCDERCPLERYEEILQERLYKSHERFWKKCFMVGDERPWAYRKYAWYGFGIGFMILVMYSSQRIQTWTFDKVKNQNNIKTEQANNQAH